MDIFDEFLPVQCAVESYLNEDAAADAAEYLLGLPYDFPQDLLTEIISISETRSKSPWFHNEYTQNPVENCIPCDDIFPNDLNMDPKHTNLDQFFLHPEHAKNYLYTKTDCNVSQCSGNCSARKVKENPCTCNIGKIRNAEENECDYCLSFSSTLGSAVKKKESLIKQSSPTELKSLEEKPREEKPYPKLQPSLIKAATPSITHPPSRNREHYYNKLPLVSSLGSPTVPKLRISRSILKSNATNVQNQRALKPLQPSATTKLQHNPLKSPLLMPKQLESDGDSPRSISPQSYGSFEEMKLDEAQLNTKLFNMINGAAPTLKPPTAKLFVDENDNGRVTRRCSWKEDNATNVVISPINIEHSYSKIDDYDYTMIQTEGKKGYSSSSKWNQTCQYVMDLPADLCKNKVVSLSKRAKQPESSLLSTAQLTAPVSIAQPIESVRRSSRIQRSENRKRSFEDLSPQSPPAKRTKRTYKKKVNLTREKISDAAKKETHNMNEKKRRNNIKRLFGELRRAIPNIENNLRASKFQVLQEAQYEVIELRRKSESIEEENQNINLMRAIYLKLLGKLQRQCFSLGIKY